MKSSSLINEGLHFAKVKSIERGTQIHTKKGLVDRVWVTFTTRKGEKIRSSILIFQGSRLLHQLKSATVGRLAHGLISSEIVGYECVIEVEHDFTGMDFVATVIGIYNAEDYEEAPDDDE